MDLYMVSYQLMNLQFYQELKSFLQENLKQDGKNSQKKKVKILIHQSYFLITLFTFFIIGIQKVSKKRVVWNEERAEYLPTFGYKNQGKSSKDLSEWIHEVPENQGT